MADYPIQETKGVLAPIALFVYARIDHTQRTIKTLKNNALIAKSELFVFSDGPRTEADKERVKAVREYLKTIDGFSKVTVVERDRNLGLAESIITGVTGIVNRYGRIIVLEDDMITSPYFLRFMNDALEFYKDEEKVISIHGYIYPVKARLPETFFLRGADCWGWATWKRGWELFEPDGRKLLNELRERKLTRRFDFDGTYGYTRMLEEQIKGKNDSWAIRWHASAFLKDKLTLYPGRSLVCNIGADASGTHCGTSESFDTEVSHEPLVIGAIALEEDRVARQQIKEFFCSTRRSGIGRILNRQA
jgi:glycosyltransferase involved in cell wall biosynthesis